MSHELEVAVELDGATVHVGTAHVDRRRDHSTTSFRYDGDYLIARGAYDLDPGLRLDEGRGIVDGLPGAFTDCAPDRWGRRLIARRLRATEATGAAARSISDLDYLLGVSDLTRQGALRFRLRGHTEYADHSGDVPKLVRLPELLNAADLVARDDGTDFSAIKVLLDAGTGTLGGARPKASVRGEDDRLHIAKFPHHDDDWDVMAWEKTALDLAERAGIEVPDRRTTVVDGRTVLLLGRFDRDRGRRVGYLSAMTLTQGSDGAAHDYLDLAAEISEVSAAAETDLADLWRRIAFSIAIHNTDDHLRNHGFLRARGGWRMSPLFDVNPNPDTAEERVTSIGWTTKRLAGLTALMDSAGQFGLSDDQARCALGEVDAATAHWREVAVDNGVAERDLATFEGAFEGLRQEMHSKLDG